MAQRKSSRIEGLDGLRGLASLVVVLRHTSNAIAMPWDLRRALIEGPLALLLNSQGAVQLFFVLSGYVLARSLERNSGWVAVVGFYAKRILRIHPPYVLTVLACWILSFFFVTSHPGDITPWVIRSARVDLDWQQLALSLRFPGMAFGLVPQGWTLTIELIFSFLLPVMLLAARRTHWLTLLILSAWALLLGREWRTFWYAIDFSLGVVAYLERDRTRRWIAALPSWVSLVLVFAALALFSAPLILGWSVRAPDSGILVGGGDPRGILIMGIGSAALVSLAVDVPWWRRLLSMRPVAFLGKTSFSLYLLHRVVITLAAPRIETSLAWLDALLLFVIVLGVSIPLSAWFYQWAERPSIAAGSRCSSWISARAGAKRVS